MSKALITTDIGYAAARLKAGKLVAFPTETVYGLGASTFDSQAVKRVFDLKGRPVDNPLIVHIPSADWLDRVAINIPEDAYTLFEAFSPGPLTLVLQKKETVPDIVSAGLATVAVRIPDHELARELISKTRVPLVAPSANISGTPSPTTAGHVLSDFADSDVVILDGGPCAIGLESTVLDLTVQPPAILRPGLITAADIEKKTGLGLASALMHDNQPKAPGQKYRHYAPRAVVVPVLNDTLFNDALRGINVTDGSRIGIFADEATLAGLDVSGLSTFAYGAVSSPGLAAKSLYAAFRAFDERGVETIFVPLFDADKAVAYNDRVKRAAAAISRVLFVCTGNTCRSPMAEAFFNAHAPAGWLASSAGLAAVYGATAAPHAIATMQSRGLDLTCHRATRVSSSLLQNQTVVVPLTAAHEKILLNQDMNLADKMLVLSSLTDDGCEIGDPYGANKARYEASAAAIERAVLRLIDQIVNGRPVGS